MRKVMNRITRYWVGIGLCCMLASDDHDPFGKKIEIVSIIVIFCTNRIVII